LLDDPKAGGMPRDIEMPDAPPTVVDDENAVEHTKRNGRDGKKVHRSDDFPVVTEEDEPALGWLRISWCSAHPAGDSSFGDIKTEHHKLTVDTRCAPGRVLRHHPKDQTANFFRNPSSAHLIRLRNRAPIEREPTSVPSYDGLRAHDSESLFPSGPEPPRQNPEELIECC